MDWTKIKTKHFLFNNLSYAQKGYLATLLCYVAHLEREPTDEEIRKNLGENVAKFCRNSDGIMTELWQKIVEKVLEDVEKVHRKKERDRSFHRTYDKSRQRDTETNSSPREDKIREDKRRYIHTFEELWERYPKKDGKKQAVRYFQSSVKSDEDVADIRRALENYLVSDAVQRGFIKNGSTWFNNWQDWINYKGVEDESPREQLRRVIREAKEREQSVS